MHFIKLTHVNNRAMVINAEKILGIVDFDEYRTILFCFDVGGKYAHKNVVETIDEIVAKCQNNKEPY